MSQYKAYPKYKDSGIEWIGQVPEHWVTGSLKHVIAEISSGTSVNAADTPAQNGELGVLKTSCVSSGKFDPSENKAVVPEEYDRVTCPVESGALIVSRMNTPNLVGAAGLVSHAPDGIFLPDRLWQVSFTGMVPVFAYYWSQSSLYRTQVKVICTGTSSSMQNLSQDDFKNFVLGFPDLEEQSTIADTLDRETARIDALIEKKTRFIELLKEKRQALITHAVTKGLDPNAKMKDSGIEWIGQVPEHWGEERIFVNFLEVNVRGGEQSELLAVSQQYGVIPQKEYEELLGRRLSAQEKGDYSNYKRVVTGDLVYNKMRMWQGAIGIVPCEGIVSPAYVTFRPRGEFAAQYWHWLFKSNNFLVEVNRNSQGICDDQNSCNYDEFRTIRVPIPPAHEQTIIVNGVNAEALRIDALIEKTKQSITLLKERRAAFITAAVTGQIDLRGEH